MGHLEVFFPQILIYCSIKTHTHIIMKEIQSVDISIRIIMGTFSTTEATFYRPASGTCTCIF